MAEEKAKNKVENHKRHKNTPVLEWIIAAIGLILVVTVLGTTLYRAVTEESTPPILEISVDSIVPIGNNWLVKFRVKNTGKQTAAALTIEGTLKRGTESVEISTATLAYMPANSQREGGLFFTKNPSEFELKIRASGYEKP